MVFCPGIVLQKRFFFWRYNSTPSPDSGFESAEFTTLIIHPFCVILPIIRMIEVSAKMNTLNSRVRKQLFFMLQYKS